MKGAAPLLLWDRPVSSLGLDLFFSLSGYLIYDSWLRDPRFGPFLLKRALRIFPALIVCVLACIAIGAAATTLPLGTYLSRHATWQFLLNIALYLRLYLPGVFTHRLLGGAVNGSLWSLFPEVLCYLAVPLVWLGAGWARGLALLAIMGACGAGGLYMFAYHPTGYSLIYSADPKYVLVQIPFFMAGAFWRQLEMRLPALFRLDGAVILCALTFLLPLLVGPASVPFRWLTFSYVVIAFGRQSTPLLGLTTRFGDLSYGAYLYAFPIQQLVLDHTHGFAITLATAITLAVALLSWHLIERPALRLKPRKGRRPDMELGQPATVAPSVRTSRAGRGWRAWCRVGLHLAGRTPLLPAIAALLCLVVYAGQLGLGHWQLDEFLLFGSLRHQGWDAVLPRLLVSPLPFSEALLFLYGGVVLASHNPLVWQGLALLWGGVLVCMVMAARSVLAPSHWRLITAATLAGALFAFVLVTSSVTEMFYWPVAAAAYLPTAGSAAILLFLLSRPLGPQRRLACGAALLVAAASSEMGAAMAIGFAGAVIVSGGPRRPMLRESLWWVCPALLGVAVLVVAHTASPRAEGFPSAGHFMLSLEMGLRSFMREFAGSGDRAGAAMIAARLVFALGFAAVWQRADSAKAVPNRWHAALAVSLVTAALFSTAAAYAHYGELCCERQETTRSWFYDLLAILGASWLLARFQSWHRIAFLPPLLLALSLLPVLADLRELRADYANYSWATRSWVRTWRSAAQPGTGQMEFYLPPDSPGMMIHGYAQPIGTFKVGPDAPERITAIARFFGKDLVVTCQPWQTEQSWLIEGIFVPACPPHGGPPDRVSPIP